MQTKQFQDIKQQLADTEDMIFELIAERNTEFARKMSKTLPEIKGKLISTFHNLYESSSWLEFVGTSKNAFPKSPN